MKLILFLLCLPFVGLCQSNNTDKGGSGNAWIVDFGYISAQTMLRMDTVRVILLCSDTTERQVTVTLLGHESSLCEATANYCFWKYGYMVYQSAGVFIRRMPYYLDSDKKPLPASIIVWFYRQVGPINPEIIYR